MRTTITLDATPANDTAPRRVLRIARAPRPAAAPAGTCIGCEQFPAEGADGLCAVCITSLNEAIDARARWYVDDEGAALAGGFDVSDSLRFID